MAGVILEWGPSWQPVEPGNRIQEELIAELGATHPLTPLRPAVFGRCLACDDIVAAVDHVAGEPEFAVVHLTWQGSADRGSPREAEWPYYERMTMAEFNTRFLRGEEHL